MNKRPASSDKLKFLYVISAICFFAMFLLGFRIYKTSSLHFLFLLWNLFLAAIPWALTTIIMLFPLLRKKRILLLAIAIIWILFIPNSFYIITDLFHLNYKNLAPVWYDLILIFSFAWAGLLLGFSSLKDLEIILYGSLNKKRNKIFVPIAISFILFLSSFGIYMGRFLRWNSWNILNQPADLFHDIKIRVLNPGDHPSTWGMTILTGIMLNLIWWSFKIFNTNFKKNIIIDKDHESNNF